MGHNTPDGLHTSPNALVTTSAATSINLHFDNTCLTVFKTQQWVHFGL